MAKHTTLEDGQVLDLRSVTEEMQGDAAYLRGGHTARTLLRAEDLRVVVVTMKEGSSIAEHRAEHSATIHVVAGSVCVRFRDRKVDLRAGQVVVLEQKVRHAVDAIADSCFVLTLGWRPGLDHTADRDR